MNTRSTDIDPAPSADKPRYKSRSLQKVFDACTALAHDKTSELYNKDGSQRGGANVRCAFWDGYNGANVKHRIPAGTMLQAAYQAGREFARMSQRCGVPATGHVDPSEGQSSALEALEGNSRP